MNNRSGTYVKNMTGEAEYLSFCPTPLPVQLDLNSETLQLLIHANNNIAKLNTIAEYIPDVNMFVSMYVRKEALMSSQIEGTQCTLEDILDPNLDISANADAGDVINYVKAADFALGELGRLPLCSRLLRSTHEILMSGVRGQEKNPGEFRRSQNWIGASGCSLKNARYIPPNPDDMEKAMSDLEKYINEDNEYDPLVRAALIHYQFETIHPFLDGNGRIGRLLILLYLIQQRLLNKPVIYVSYFLKKNQIEYYDRISEVRRTGNYEQWVGFFLEAVDAAAEDAIQTIYAISKLHDENINKLPQSGRSADTVRSVFDYLELHPIIDIGRTAQELNLSYNTVSSAVKKMIDSGILVQMSGKSRNRVFVYENYLRILRQDT